MKKSVKIVLLIVTAVMIVVGVMNLVNVDIHVERTKSIDASVETIQPLITDFKKFETWSPWADIDPNATAEFKGTQGEVGAEFHWSGNDEIGTGYQKVTSITPERIDLDLVFTSPWESESKVYYTFASEGGSTDVTWAYDGEMPMMASLFVDMEEVLGGQYEKGLNSLKEKLEQ